MGMLTGSTVFVLGSSSQWLATVNYYDKQNRLIQQIGDNHLGRVDVVNNQYNFTGQLVYSERIIKPLQDTTVDVKDRYVYDHLNRLMDTHESFRGAAEVDISHNVYNEIGQKVTEGLHAMGIVPPGALPATAATITENSTVTGTKQDVATNSVKLEPGFSYAASGTNSYVAAIGKLFAQSQEFRYNIKGWVTNINNGTLTNDNITQTDPNALFGESITYYESSPLSGATPQYNGNISGMTWRNKIEASGKPGVVTGGQGYAVDYDNVNRITASNYYTQTGGTFTPSAYDAFNEKVLDYDEMGNINRLDRSDKTGSALNSLYYTYGTNGNKLTSIVDNVLHLKSGTFSYDGNGNMITDTYSGITVSYNYLDLPDTVKNGSDKLVFTYDAAGNKLYQMLYIGGNLISQRHYIDDAIVTANPSIPVNGKIESIAMDEGLVVNTGAGGYKYEYNLQDHLFNNRVNFRVDHDGTVNLSQVRNYYPFGEMMGDSTMNYALTPVDLFQYSGKELQPGLDLNTYDFGARNYDPVLGRWWSMDPLGLEFDDQSPYGYVGNNPMNMIDPDGMQYGSQSGRNIIQTPGPDYKAVPWGTIGKGVVGASAAWEGYQAFKAFSMSYKTIENFSTIGNLQGNVITPNKLGIQNNFTTSSKNSQAAFVGGALLTSGWISDAADPEPFSKVGGFAIMTGVTIHKLYQNRTYLSNSAVALYNKMTAEIDRIAQKAAGPQGVQYALVAEQPGVYPNVRGGTKFLNTGDVWKYGETTDPNGRYSPGYLRSMKLIKVDQFPGNKIEIRIQEKIMIYGYFIQHGSLPPGNHIFR